MKMKELEDTFGEVRSSIVISGKWWCIFQKIAIDPPLIHGHLDKACERQKLLYI